MNSNIVMYYSMLIIGALLLLVTVSVYGKIKVVLTLIWGSDFLLTTLI